MSVRSSFLTKEALGTRPTNGISIEFEIRWKFGVLLVKYAQPITTKFFTRHDSYTVYVMNKNITKFHWISNSIKISLVGRALGLAYI